MNHAREQEVDQRRRGRRISPSPTLTVEEFANEWYKGLDLEPTTMIQYRGILENHILPRWGDWVLRDIADADAEVTQWTKELREAGYSESRITAIRGRFATMCTDAVQRGYLYRNPATVPRSRGRAAPRRTQRQQQHDRKVVTTPLGALLIAERCAVLTGRDDEFVMLLTKYFTGLRWGELIGIEQTQLSLNQLRVQWQLSATGRRGLTRRPPKHGSRRTIDIPPFLGPLLRDQAARVCHPDVSDGEQWCPCGRDLPSQYRHEPGIHVFAGRTGEPHWAHNSFIYQYWSPAARGLYFPGARQERPVYVEAREDGTEIGLWDRATRRFSRPDAAVACWASIAPGMRGPHGLRHSHKTLMEELGTAAPLMDERMGHLDPSVQARYSHVTPTMRARLCEALTGVWEEALRSRAALAPHSPVAALDARLAPLRGHDASPCPQNAPSGTPRRLRSTRNAVA